jgi:hypothetical protein
MPLGSAITGLPVRLSNIIATPITPTVVAQPAIDVAASAATVPAAGPAADASLIRAQLVTSEDQPDDVRMAPSLSLINEVVLSRARLLRPDLDVVFRPRPGLPREQVTVPICRNGSAPGQPELLFSTLLEEPAVSSPQAACYVPRYKLGVEDVVGGQQLRVRLEPEAQGGKLTVHLAAYADPAIALAARAARPIDAPLTVELRYPRAIGAQTTWDTLAFQEIAGEPGGIQAVLHVDALALPQLHMALQTPGTTLVVRRTIDYAVAAEMTIQDAPPRFQIASMARRSAPMLRRRDDDGGPIIDDGPPPRDDDGGGVVIEPPPPPPPPPPEELFALRSSAVEDTLACSFPASYTYIFQDGPQAGGQSLALRPFTRPWQARQYSYYQDPARPWRFFYLPDAFKIARQDAPPRSPAIKITTSGDKVTMSYAAAPYTDAARLADAARQLADAIPPGTRLPDGVRGPTFELLATAKATFRLALPQPGGAGGPLVERPNVGLDLNNPAKGLPGGIFDSFTLTMDDFLPVFDALCADQRRDGANTLLLGQVDVALGDTPLPPIPFVARLNDLVGELFGYAEDELPSADRPDLLGARSTFTNAIESPVRIERLNATLHRSNDLSTEARAVIRDEALQPLSLPITLAPGAQLRLVVTPESTIGGAGPLDAVFDLLGCAAVPDPALVLDTILGDAVTASRAMPVEVKLPRAVFGNQSDPGGALYAVSVRFAGRGQFGEDLDVDFAADTADQPTGSTTSSIITRIATLYMPARAFLLRQPEAWSYGYSVTLRRTGGTVAGESGTRTGTSYWPKVM